MLITRSMHTCFPLQPSGVSATGPEPIRAAINALNLKYTKVDLTNGYVDAQKSANNGVFVLVVGTLAPPDAPDKPFVQTFLLSNQVQVQPLFS